MTDQSLVERLTELRRIEQETDDGEPDNMGQSWNDLADALIDNFDTIITALSRTPGGDGDMLAFGASEFACTLEYANINLFNKLATAEARIAELEKDCERMTASFCGAFNGRAKAEADAARLRKAVEGAMKRVNDCADRIANRDDVPYGTRDYNDLRTAVRLAFIDLTAALQPEPGCPHCGYRHPPDGVCV